MSDLLTVDCFLETENSLSFAHVKEHKFELDLQCGGMQDYISVAHDRAITKQQRLTKVVKPSINEEETGDNC